MNRWINTGIALLVVLFLFRIETKLEFIQDQVEEIQAQVMDLNRIVKTGQTVAYDKKELDCLAKNIYYEAGVEDKVGKYAVGHITLNRLQVGAWGKSICSVVYAKAQFSWTLLKKLPKVDPTVYAEAESIAWDVIHGHRVASLGKGLFYHADYIKLPAWAEPKEQITKIGRHIFYTKAKNSWLQI